MSKDDQSMHPISNTQAEQPIVQHHRKISLAEVPSHCARWIATPAAATILEEIRNLEEEIRNLKEEIQNLEREEGKLLGVEVETRRSLGIQIQGCKDLIMKYENFMKEQKTLLIATADGPTAVDELYPRLVDTSFLNQARRQGLRTRPYFAAFSPHNHICSFTVTDTMSGVVRTDSVPALLGKHFRCGWSLDFGFLRGLSFGLTICASLATIGGTGMGIAAAQHEAPIAALFYAGLGALGGVSIGAILTIAGFFLISLGAEHTREWQTRFLFTIPAPIRQLIKTIEKQFEEVLLIAEATEWLEKEHKGRPCVAPDSGFLVVVRNGENWWLAATVIQAEKVLKELPAELRDL